MLLPPHQQQGRTAGEVAPCPRAARVWGTGLGMPRGSPRAVLSPRYLSKRLPAWAAGHALWGHGGHPGWAWGGRLVRGQTWCCCPRAPSRGRLQPAQAGPQPHAACRGWAREG